MADGHGRGTRGLRHRGLAVRDPLERVASKYTEDHSGAAVSDTSNSSSSSAAPALQLSARLAELVSRGLVPRPPPASSQTPASSTAAFASAFGSREDPAAVGEGVVAERVAKGPGPEANPLA